jgi:hypothetical protein
MPQENRTLTITELNLQEQPKLTNLSVGVRSKENKAKRRAKKESRYFYASLTLALIGANIAFSYISNNQLSTDETKDDISTGEKFLNSLIISTPLLLLFIKGKSSIYNKVIIPTLPNLNASKDIAPTQKKRAILWTMSPKLKVFTFVFEHFYRSTYTKKQWLDIQKYIWQQAGEQSILPFAGLSAIHNEILDPHTTYPRRLIYLNILSWVHLSLDLLNLGVFELDNHINGFRQLATISPILRNYSRRHRYNAYIRYSLGSLIKLAHTSLALIRYYPHLLLGNLNHSIVAAFNSNKHPNRLLFFGFLINLFPIIGLAIYAYTGSRQNQPQHQQEVAQTRNTFALIHAILLLQGPFYIAPIINPIDPKNRNKILKYLNPNHLYKAIFKQYLERTQIDSQNLIFSSFLYNNKKDEDISSLGAEQDTPESLLANIVNINLRIFMPLATLNASLGLIRNALALGLKYVFEYNAGSDRSNPILACVRFFAGLILGPIIATCSLLKKITNIPNQIFMNSYNQSAIFPQRMTAFIFAIALTLGIHHKYFSDMEFSLPVFLSVLCAMSLQLTAVITAPIHYATPKHSPIELFLNYTNNQSSYEELLNNPTNIEQPPTDTASELTSEQSVGINIWNNHNQETKTEITH